MRSCLHFSMQIKCCGAEDINEINVRGFAKTRRAASEKWAKRRTLISVAEAQALILKEAHSFGTEKIALEESVGRILAQDAVADRDYPPFNRSAMDGFAIAAEDFAVEKSFPVQGTVFAGDSVSPKAKWKSGAAVKIMTGAAVPRPFNAVIRREDAIEEGGLVRFTAGSAKAWHNVSRQGEDLQRKEKIPVQGRAIDNATISLLASLGIAKPLVARLPRVAIISTGNEIIHPAKKPLPTQIRNSNVFALTAQLADFGIGKVTTTHVPDDAKKLGAAIDRYAVCDILLLTGGVSAGDSDHVPEVLAKLKFRKVFHKVQMKPGKPLWFGRRSKTAVFAIPGNPFSAQVIFRIFIEPYLRKCLGMGTGLSVALPLADGRRKKDALENFFPVKVETTVNSISTLAQLPFNGSGDIRAALFSDGIARHPATVAELAGGSVVDFYPWRLL